MQTVIILGARTGTRVIMIQAKTEKNGWEAKRWWLCLGRVQTDKQMVEIEQIRTRVRAQGWRYIEDTLFYLIFQYMFYRKFPNVSIETRKRIRDFPGLLWKWRDLNWVQCSSNLYLIPLGPYSYLICSLHHPFFPISTNIPTTCLAVQTKIHWVTKILSSSATLMSNPQQVFWPVL